MTIFFYRWPTARRLPPAIPFALAVGTAAILITTLPLIVTAVPSLHEIEAGFARSSRLFAAPDLAYLPEIGQRIVETVEIAFASTVLAALISLPLGVLAARSIAPKSISSVVRSCVNTLRAIPEFVLALLFVSAVGLGPLPGVMTLTIAATALLVKLYADSFEVVDPKAIEAVQVTGAGRWHVMSFAIFPQALPDLLSATFYIFDNNVRTATILGLVGAGGIGYDLVMAAREFEYERVMLITLAIFAIVTVVDFMSSYVRRRLMA